MKVKTAVLLVGMALAGGSCGSGEKSAPPSIFLITMDALRPDHMGAYGYDLPTTPNLDQVAAEGVLFERAFAHAPETRFSWTPRPMPTATSNSPTCGRAALPRSPNR